LIKKILLNRKGEGYIDVVIMVLCSMMVIVLALNVFSFLTLKQDLDYYAKEMVTVAAVNGTMNGTEISNRITELTEETGLNPTITYEGEGYNDPDRVQLGKTIFVTLTINTSFKGFGVFNFPLTLKAKCSGLSQVHWN